MVGKDAVGAIISLGMGDIDMRYATKEQPTIGSMQFGALQDLALIFVDSII